MARSCADSLLFVGGRLATQPPVGSAVANVGEGLAFFIRVDGIDSSDVHRSVFLPVVRDQVPESLALFDFPDPSLVTGQRASTTGPAQALYFLNGPLVISPASRSASARTAAVSRVRAMAVESRGNWVMAGTQVRSVRACLNRMIFSLYARERPEKEK